MISIRVLPTAFTCKLHILRQLLHFPQDIMHMTLGARGFSPRDTRAVL
ncbi:Protein of unknown function [Pyronema omphalodes CBS 100304]|uniref:Uncharacterized protein n=1 Tax=Pyronema omphalodes (strain CBS 100304) TaxID=1076935 RepID=U4KYK9_PYROM|nr:Protein of unknown function [Pyronema omphalodes CBS 100304]